MEMEHSSKVHCAKQSLRSEKFLKKDVVVLRTKQELNNGILVEKKSVKSEKEVVSRSELSRSRKRRLRKQKINSGLSTQLDTKLSDSQELKSVFPITKSELKNQEDSHVKDLTSNKEELSVTSGNDIYLPKVEATPLKVKKEGLSLDRSEKEDKELKEPLAVELRDDIYLGLPISVAFDSEREGTTMPVNREVEPNREKGEKKKEDVLAERESRKLAKQAAKRKKVEGKTEGGDPRQESRLVREIGAEFIIAVTSDKVGGKERRESRENEEREAVRVGGGIAMGEVAQEEDTGAGDVKVEVIGRGGEAEVKPDKSKAELRAERRAKQEAQRAAKEAEKQKKPAEANQKPVEKKRPELAKEKESTPMKEKKPVIGAKTNPSRVKLFSHLQYKVPPLDSKKKLEVHPAIVALGAKYAARVVNGSNARCLAFLQAIKQVIMDYNTPPEKEFSRGLEGQIGPSVAYLNQFRPQPVSVTNALRHLKSHINQLANNVSDDEARAKLCEVIDTYIREQIYVAALAISKTMRRKIANGDVILTYACSSLLYQLFVDSKREGTDFSVVVVDAAPWFEGREMVRRLTQEGIKSTYVLINSLSFIMRKVTTVVIGAHALLANGFVMSRAGSSLVALMASSCNVPVLVCCETHKFSERVQTDAFVYNELGDPDEIVGDGGELSDWRSFPSLSPLNLLYDITPPDLVTAVVTELAILPCTSVPVVLRVKPTDLPT